MRFSLDQLAAATGGRRHGPDVEVSAVGIDSRALPAGALFVPIVADRDGHEFVPAAIAAGAAAHLSAAGQGPGAVTPGWPAVAVADTTVALAAIGRLARRRITGPVVGITGSVGKTSTKDLAAAVFRRRFVTAAADRSFNNELGVPLTLANAPDGAEAAIIEMGARGVGHIALLCGIASPTIGIVTCVGAAHLELFGTLDDVARGKGELVEALPPSGTAVLNADDTLVAAMAKRSAAPVLRYSPTGGGADLRASGIRLGAELRARFTLHSPWGAAPVELAVAGAHMVGNALAAAAAGLAAGISLDEVAAGLGDATLSPWRMEVRRTESGATVINDAYNANPVSMRAALDALADLPARRRIAVLGAMAELGDDAEAAHRDVADHAAALGITLVPVGTGAYGPPGVAPHDAAAAVGVLGPDDAVLVKASRVAGLERVAAQLTGVSAHV
jgi:UDP-N-acetylmuramoyl-tripeptide--D-alanyl-D-alanine ligase